MKKINLILLGILAGLYILLAILGAGGEHDAERLFYKAVKMSEKILKNPDIAPPSMIASVEDMLKSILNRYPDASTVKIARVALAEFYISNKKFDETLELIGNMLNDKRSDTAELSFAQYLKGYTYEKKGEWGRALKEYGVVRDRYADTQLGLSMPIYIAKHYEEIEKNEEAVSAYREAVQFYSKLEKENRGKSLGYTSAGLLLSTYLKLKDYEAAGEVLRSVIKDYPIQLTIYREVTYIEPIFVKELKRPDEAISLYKILLSHIKDEKLKKLIQERIITIEQQKEESVKTEKSQ